MAEIVAEIAEYRNALKTQHKVEEASQNSIYGKFPELAILQCSIGLVITSTRGAWRAMLMERGFFSDWWNILKLIVVMATQVCEYSGRWTVL